jgi:hypothetical protein
MSADEHPTMMIVYQHTFDDTNDAELPVTTDKIIHLARYVVTVDDEGTETSTATDMTSHDQMVQDIASAIWTD